MKAPSVLDDRQRWGLGVWPWISLIVIFATSIYSDVSRFKNPSGEKYMPGYYFGGQFDFSYPYLGARALLAHKNPYLNSDPEFTHPLFRPENIDGKEYKQLYLPGHLLSYVPFALVYGKDAVSAGRLFFDLSLLLLVAMGVFVWLLLRRILPPATDEPISPFFIFLAAPALIFQFGVQLGLERGQSDNLTAFLCWAAVFAVVKRRPATGLFLAVWAASIKGYPCLFTVGIAVLMLQRKVWRPAAIGALAGLMVFDLPVILYMGNGIKGTLFRSKMFGTQWYNHSFRNIVHHMISPEAAETGRILLSAVALLVAVLWGWRAWQHRRNLESPEGTLSLVMFSTASLLVMIGFSSLSVSYNLIMILPGVILLAACQERLVATLGIGPVGRHLLGVAITFSGYALFLGHWMPDFPLASLGLVILMVLLGVLAIRMSWRPPLPTPQPLVLAVD